MKKVIGSFIIFLGLCSSVSPVHAAYHAFDQAAGSGPSTAVDKSQLEGWITQVNYQRSNFRMLDPRGFERTITLKPGIIADYRMGDHVKVTMQQTYPYATLVEKL